MKVILVLLILLGLFVISFVYIDPYEGCLIVTRPNIMPSAWKVSDIMKIVKVNDTRTYRLICENITYISKDMPIGCPFYDGGCFKQDTPKTLYVGNDINNLAFTSAILVHEACHLEQWLDKKQFLEGECYNKDSAFIKNIQQF